MPLLSDSQIFLTYNFKSLNYTTLKCKMLLKLISSTYISIDWTLGFRGKNIFELQILNQHSLFHLADFSIQLLLNFKDYFRNQNSQMIVSSICQEKIRKELLIFLNTLYPLTQIFWLKSHVFLSLRFLIIKRFWGCRDGQRETWWSWFPPSSFMDFPE